MEEYDCGHLLLLIFPSQGSITPSIEFAKRLTRLGVRVTILTSLSAHRRITKSSSSSSSTSLIGTNIVSFSDGYDDGFEDIDNPNHFISELKTHGSQAIAQVITDCAQQGHPITFFVYTMLQTWAARVAQAHNVPSAPLWIQPAIVFDIYHYYFNGYAHHLTISYQNRGDGQAIELPGLPSLTASDLPSYLSSSNTYAFALPQIEDQLQHLQAESNPLILVNTFDMLEPMALHLEATNKLYNMIPVGPLVPVGSSKSEEYCYIKWLNSKPESSVVYVSFGSIAVLSDQQLEEIARGLVESGRPFAWVIRKSTKLTTSTYEKLQEIVELSSGKGLILPWCSQVEVLSHPSVGCFFTHCGWNSTMESLVTGIPVVGFPQWTDQLTNAKLIQDVFRIGVKVVMGDDDDDHEKGIVRACEIKRCIEMVMGSGEKGEDMRRNAKKWKDLAREAVKEGGTSDCNLKAFVKKASNKIN